MKSVFFLFALCGHVLAQVRPPPPGPVSVPPPSPEPNIDPNLPDGEPTPRPEPDPRTTTNRPPDDEDDSIVDGWSLAKKCRGVRRSCSDAQGDLQDVLLQFEEAVTDVNGQTVSAQSLTNFLRNNLDGCPTPDQVQSRLLDVGFTKMTARALEESLGLVYLERYPECVQVPSNWMPLSINEFTNNILQGLINTCEMNPRWYNNDCICTQLPSFCMLPNIPKPKFAACTEYQDVIADRPACVFRPITEDPEPIETFGLTEELWYAIFNNVCGSGGGPLLRYYCGIKGLYHV